MSILFTFPGQGAQRTGMLHALPRVPEVQHTLEQTANVLGTDPLLLDTATALTSTYAVQLCLLIAGVAMARVLLRTMPRRIWSPGYQSVRILQRWSRGLLSIRTLFNLYSGAVD